MYVLKEYKDNSNSISNKDCKFYLHKAILSEEL